MGIELMVYLHRTNRLKRRIRLVQTRPGREDWTTDEGITHAKGHVDLSRALYALRN
jgi:hypothetical protein